MGRGEKRDGNCSVSISCHPWIAVQPNQLLESWITSGMHAAWGIVSVSMLVRPSEFLAVGARGAAFAGAVVAASVDEEGK